MATQLKAGTARAITTPPVGITHAHWGAQTHTRATGVDLDLWTTALVLVSGDTQVAIVDTDLGGYPRDLVERIRDAVENLTGIPASHLRLSASHTHSGGNVSPAWYPDGGEMIPGYQEALVYKIAGAVWQAQRNLRPARVAAGMGHADVAMNRRTWHPEQRRIFLGRNRDAEADQTLPVARIDGEDEQPIAVLVSYSCHPTIMAHLNSLITPDYPGVLRRTVEANVGGHCLFLQGATGDQHSQESFSSRREDYHHVGRVLGLEAAKVATQLRTRPTVERLVEILESGAELGIYADEPGPEPDATLRVATRTVDLPLRELPRLDEAQADHERKVAALNDALPTGDVAEIRARGYQAKRAGIMLTMARNYQGQTHATIELQVIRVGQLAMVSMPGEPFARTGLEIRRRSPFAVTMVSGYSNEQFTYIPTRRDYEVGGYGVWNSPVGPGGDEAIVEGAEALLNQVV